MSDHSPVAVSRRTMAAAEVAVLGNQQFSPRDTLSRDNPVHKQIWVIGVSLCGSKPRFGELSLSRTK